MSLSRPVLALCLSVIAGTAALAQRYEAVQRTPGHEQIKAMAAEVILRSNRVPAGSIAPIFYTCTEGHLHWNLGYTGIETDSFPMQERLQIEWFRSHLATDQRPFWEPYFWEVDGLIDSYIRLSPQAYDA